MQFMKMKIIKHQVYEFSLFTLAGSKSSELPESPKNVDSNVAAVQSATNKGKM